MSNKAFPYFPLQRPIRKGLICGVVYNFQCGLCNESYYGESIRHLDIRPGEHISVSPLPGKKVKPSNNSAICLLTSFSLFHNSLFNLVSLFLSNIIIKL